MSNMFPGSVRNEHIEPSDAEKISASSSSQDSKIYAAKRLVGFFELDVTLKIFGNVVFIWHFPPKCKTKI